MLYIISIMKNILLTEVDRSIDYLEKALNRIEKGTGVANDNSFRLKKQGIYYYPVLNKHYLKLNSPETKVLLNQYYCKKLLAPVKKELSALKEFKRNYSPEDKYLIYDSLPETISTYIDPIIPSPQQTTRRWLADTKRQSSFLEDKLIYEAKCGIRVRSKSELIIADILTEYHIPFKYEAPYQTDHQNFRPDFTIIHPRTGHFYYIEYFGLMDDPEYATNAYKKIAIYQNSTKANRFIFFFESESSPMNISSIKNTIERYFID